MPTPNALVIAQLKRDILPLQGYKHAGSETTDAGLAAIKAAFPQKLFPTGAMHEFFCSNAEEMSASGGFIAGILSALMKNNRITVWISNKRTIFPPALAAFNIRPEHVVFITLRKEVDLVWAMEEALKCEGLAAVVGEIRDLSFTASRRLQLAVENSGVTGFLLRRDPRNLTTACVARWKIQPIESKAPQGVPGVGFPRWKVSLLKVRNGAPGTWELEWVGKKFRTVQPEIPVIGRRLKTKAG